MCINRDLFFALIGFLRVALPPPPPLSSFFPSSEIGECLDSSLLTCMMVGAIFCYVVGISFPAVVLFAPLLPP